MTTFNLYEAERLANLFASTKEAQSPREATALDNAHKAATQLRAAIAEVKRLREREGEARAILQSLEWMCDDSHGFYVCEDCGSKAERKKFPNEQLAAWLKGAEDAG